MGILAVVMGFVKHTAAYIVTPNKSGHVVE